MLICLWMLINENVTSIVVKYTSIDTNELISDHVSNTATRLLSLLIAAPITPCQRVRQSFKCLPMLTSHAGVFDGEFYAHWGRERARVSLSELKRLCGDGVDERLDTVKEITPPSLSSLLLIWIHTSHCTCDLQNLKSKHVLRADVSIGALLHWIHWSECDVLRVTLSIFNLHIEIVKTIVRRMHALVKNCANIATIANVTNAIQSHPWNEDKTPKMERNEWNFRTLFDGIVNLFLAIRFVVRIKISANDF